MERADAQYNNVESDDVRVKVWILGVGIYVWRGWDNQLELV
jgi:hypothetical protein